MCVIIVIAVIVVIVVVVVGAVVVDVCCCSVVAVRIVLIASRAVGFIEIDTNTFVRNDVVVPMIPDFYSVLLVTLKHVNFRRNFQYLPGDF